MSSDVELNPGPVDFPCGNCALEVNESDSAINCDECGQWFHIQCQSIWQDAYEDLVATDRSLSRGCSNLDQLGKPTLRSRYAHTPFGSAPIPTPSSQKQITIFVIMSRKVCKLSGVLIGRAKIFVLVTSYWYHTGFHLLAGSYLSYNR